MTRPALLLTLLALLTVPLHAAPPAVLDPEASQENAQPFVNPVTVAGPTVPAVRSHYAVLMDAATGKILWARNAAVHRPMASTTKMMTAILLLERGRLTDTVTATNDVAGLPDSSLHLSPGEKLTLHDLLYAMLLRSANDTAVAGADYLCGSVPAFVAQMNAKAKEIGASDTHFVTPNGLYAPGHYSTAADLAKIAAYATANLPEFNAIVRTPKYKITRSIHIHDEWVKNTAYTFLLKFPGADGVKTGYVHQAGHCFVGSATRLASDGKSWRLIAVALNSNDCREDVASLLNYGFHNFQPTEVVPLNAGVGTVQLPGAGQVPVRAAKAVRVVVSRWQARPVFQVKVTPLRSAPSLPVAAGTKVGILSVLIHGKPQATADALADRSVALLPAAAIARVAGNVRWPIVLVVVVALFVGTLFYARYASKTEAPRRRKPWAHRLQSRAARHGTPAKSDGRRRSGVAPHVRRVD